MKKIIFCITGVLLSIPSFSLNTCICENVGQGTWTTTTYLTEGGCCSGIPSEGGIQHQYKQNEQGTYTLQTTSSISGEAAQSNCCQNNV